MFIFVSLLAVMSQRLRYIQNIDRNTQSWRGSGGWQFHWSPNPLTHASPHRILRFLWLPAASNSRCFFTACPLRYINMCAWPILRFSRLY